MKTIFGLAMALGISLALAWPAHARNIKRLLPIAAAMEAKDLQPKLDGSTKLFFGKAKSPEGLKTLRTEVTLGKVNLRGKSEETACNSAFLSALADLQKRAKQRDANAIVNIVSYYKRAEMSSTTEYECHEGSGYMAVELRGDLVKIADK
jgi:hypothetical protein